MLPVLLLTAILQIGLFPAPVVAQQLPQPTAESSDWTVTGAQSAESATVFEFSMKTGKFRWRDMPADESIVQVVALFESAKTTSGPIPLPEILLINRSATDALAKRAFTPQSAGTWNQNCSFLDGREIPDKQKVTVTLGSGNQLILSNQGENQLQLAITDRRVHLCLAFAVPNSMSGKWALRVGGVEVPLMQGISSFAAIPAGSLSGDAKDTDPVAASMLTAIGKTLSQHRFVIAALLLLLGVVAAIRYRRMLHLENAENQWAQFPTTFANQPVPALSESDLPTGYCELEGDAGPASAIFSAASRSMQGDDFASATELLGQSLKTGLTPGYESKAHLFLAEAALSRSDLLGAMHEYRLCVRGNQVLRWSALPAAKNLALIYRKLGMLDSEKLAQRIVAEAPNAGESLHPTQVQRISELATALKWQLRTDRLRAFSNLSRQFFFSLYRRGARTNN